MNDTSGNRLDYIDVAKGIGMLLVVWAHIFVEGPINWFIYIFHMPLFFFISGMLFVPSKYQKCTALIGKRFRTLLIPYAVYSVITWIVWVAYSIVFKQHVASYWKPLLQTLIAQGSGGFLVHNVPLWFVTCLFVVEIAYFFINKIKPAVFKLILCAAISCLGYCMIEVFDLPALKLLPWSIEVACAAMIFYAVGSMFGKRAIEKLRAFRKKSVLIPLFLFLALAAVTAACSLTTEHISYGSDKLGAYPHLVYLGGFAGILMVMIASNALSEFDQKKHRFYHKALDYIRWIGRNSFRFMAVHVPVKGFLTVLAAKLFHTTTEVVGGNLLYSGMVFLITMVLVTVITMLTNVALKKLYSLKK